MPPQDEPATPLRIGAGSFAKIYVVRGGPLAFKVVHDPTQASVLQSEFTAHQKLHSLHNTFFFQIPKPHSYYNPQTNTFLQTPPPSPPSCHRQTNPLITPSIYHALHTPNPAYAMDRIHTLPYGVSSSLSTRYIPKELATDPNLRLCRLYFGKTITPSRFVNTNNFPLDITRYNILRNDHADLALPLVGHVAFGMGDMLARIHWAGYDARDVEFVVGGDGRTGDVGFWVIDFNQMREWGRTADGVEVLANAFFANDPYYPRPRVGERVYKAFEVAYLAYLARCGAGNETVVGKAFLQAIEERQRVRDRRVEVES